MKTLPPVALGTWSWGTGFAGGDTVFGNHLSDTQMAEVFTAAMSKGLNLWDTAAVYGMGSSETALGSISPSVSPREHNFIHQIHAADCGQAVCAACQRYA